MKANELLTAQLAESRKAMAEGRGMEVERQRQLEGEFEVAAASPSQLVDRSFSEKASFRSHTVVSTSDS